MKNILFIILFLSGGTSHSQNFSLNFNAIDWRVQTIDADTPDSLAVSLTSVYHTEREKVRAIFSWITQHISYNTGIYNSGRKYIPVTNIDPWDTVSTWKSGNEMTAWKVMRRKMAVCDGYAKLFKTLCDYAGIRAEVITGYANGQLVKQGKFRTNHTWNAVMIDSTWHLLDVTWASGYVNDADQFVKHTNDRYYLTPPRQFNMDHYPEDQHWVLLEKMPVVSEFRQTFFKCKSFVKYGIYDVFPKKGVIEAGIGDTIQIELQVRDAKKNKIIASDPFFDSTMMEGLPASVFLQPVPFSTKILYQYIVTSRTVEWLNILYNDDMVLRYKLDVSKELKASK